jgi:alpha-glucosidase
VYLPGGTWVDWETGECHAGGQFITSPAPLDRIPIFARGGRVIPAYAAAPSSTMGHYPDLIELTIVIPEEDGEFHSHLHEDDGISQAYAEGHFLRTTFSLSRAGGRIRLSAKVVGNGFPEFRRDRFHLVFRGGSVDRVEIDGVELRARGGRLELANRGEGFELSFVV